MLNLLVLVLLIDRTGGVVMSYCYRHTHAKAEVKIQHLTRQAAEDVIILGNSRCAYHYVPSVISDTLHMSVYNGGIDGSDNIYSQYIMVCHLLAHHTPKILCVETGGNDFMYSDDAFKKTSYFAPLFGESVQADSIFQQARTYPVYALSSLYRYNAKSIEILGGMLVRRVQDNDDGYFPIQGSRQTDLQLVEDYYSDRIDPDKMKYMERIVRMCRERHILLVWVISPAYRTIGKSTFVPIRQLAENNGNIFLDYYSSGLFLDKPEYFKDNGHLLEQGANAYSSLFARDLKTIVDKM